MLIKEANQITGGLSKVEKFDRNGTGERIGALNFPANKCGVGSILAQIPGTPCHGCYALKGRYRFDNVQNALEKRFKQRDHPLWVEAMTLLIERQSPSHFRWFDSGDLQPGMLQKIVEVCRKTPATKHWLPTQERKMVFDFINSGATIPDNLTIRLSATKIGATAKPSPFPTSAVNGIGGVDCVLTIKKIRGKSVKTCGDCRQCWDKKVPHVNYTKH